MQVVEGSQYPQRGKERGDWPLPSKGWDQGSTQQESNPSLILPCSVKKANDLCFGIAPSGQISKSHECLVAKRD